MNALIEKHHRSRAGKMLRAWVVGLILTATVFVLGQGGYFAGVSQTLLWPGLVLASLFGYGAHDLPLYVLTLLFDSFIYGVLSYGLLALIQAARS